MNSNSPCKPKGELGKAAQGFFLHGARGPIHCIPDIGPCFRLYLYFLWIIGALNNDLIFLNAGYKTDLSIEITPAFITIILNEHDLGTGLKTKGKICRIPV